MVVVAVAVIRNSLWRLLIWQCMFYVWTTSSFPLSTSLLQRTLTIRSPQTQPQRQYPSSSHSSSHSSSYSSRSTSLTIHWKLQVLTTGNAPPPAQHRSFVETNRADIDLLFDSECPICAMEVEFLKKRDIYKRIRFTDISAPDYDPRQHGNVGYVDGMKKLRAVLPNNRVITGVEVFRHTYDAIGLGWVFALTRLPFIGEMADAVYDFWAENRLRITGREDLIEKLQAQAQALREYELEECDGTCDLED